MTIEAFIAKLDKVRSRGGNRWMACCPACGEKHPSLSIKDDNGTILLRCFSQGCSAYEICDSIGFEITDLFPPSDNYDASQPKQKRLYHEAPQVLEGIAYESLVVHIISNDMLNNGSITTDEHDRLKLAVSRIHASLEYTKRIIK